MAVKKYCARRLCPPASRWRAASPPRQYIRDNDHVHMQRTFPEALPIEGSAVLTMVVSSDCIKKPKPQSTIASGCCREDLSFTRFRLFRFTRKTQSQTVEKEIHPGVVYSVRSWLMTRPPTMVIPGVAAAPNRHRPTTPAAARQQRRQGSHHNRAKTQQTGLEIASCGVRLPCRWASSAKSTI